MAPKSKSSKKKPFTYYKTNIRTVDEIVAELDAMDRLDKERAQRRKEKKLAKRLPSIKQQPAQSPKPASPTSADLSSSTASVVASSNVTEDGLDEKTSSAITELEYYQQRKAILQAQLATCLQAPFLVVRKLKQFLQEQAQEIERTEHDVTQPSTACRQLQLLKLAYRVDCRLPNYVTNHDYLIDWWYCFNLKSHQLPDSLQTSFQEVRTYIDGVLHTNELYNYYNHLLYASTVEEIDLSLSPWNYSRHEQLRNKIISMTNPQEQTYFKLWFLIAVGIERYWQLIGQRQLQYGVRGIVFSLFEQLTKLYQEQLQTQQSHWDYGQAAAALFHFYSRAKAVPHAAQPYITQKHSYFKKHLPENYSEESFAQELRNSHDCMDDAFFSRLKNLFGNLLGETDPLDIAKNRTSKLTLFAYRSAHPKTPAVDLADEKSQLALETANHLATLFAEPDVTPSQAFIPAVQALFAYAQQENGSAANASSDSKRPTRSLWSEPATALSKQAGPYFGAFKILRAPR